jgi:hypothetical protein
MQDTMESQSKGHNEPPGEDLSALAWVHGELRRALENAHKSLRRYLKEAESLGDSDVDVVDPSVLRSARNQIHQGVGALELVGLPAAATVLRAAEMAVQRMVAKPATVDTASIEAVEKVSFGLLDFLSRQLAARPCRRWPCSRSTGPRSSSRVQTACTRPTCGTSIGSGASCRLMLRPSRGLPMTKRAARWKR